MSKNIFSLEARIIERDPVRYTPAGIPLVECVLEHASEVIEAGAKRKVDMTLSAITIGECSGALADYPLGKIACFVGFLAPRSLRVRSVRFHITQIEVVEPTDT